MLRKLAGKTKIKILIGISQLSCILNFPMLAALAIYLSLFRINKIKSITNPKKKILVIYRAYGVHDLFEVFKDKQSTYDMLFIDRAIFEKIFYFFHSNRSINKENKFIFSKKYESFIKKKVFWFNKFMGPFTLLSFNYAYHSDVMFRKYTFLNSNKSKLFLKECFRTKAEEKVQNDNALNYYIKYFTDIAVYNHQTKNHFIKRLKGIENKIYVVGCPRANYSYKIGLKKNKVKIKNILFYYFEKKKGIPVRNNKFSYFKDSKLKSHKPFDWKSITDSIFETFIILAKKNPNVNFIVKAKKGEFENTYFIKKIEKLSLKNLIYINEGAGHYLLDNSQVVIGMNSVSILEAVVARRKIFIPLYKKFRKNVFSQYTFDLPSSLWVNDQKDLEKKISDLIKKKYIKLPSIIPNYNKIIKKYFFEMNSVNRNVINFLNK
jgi:hypothetical protein